MNSDHKHAGNAESHALTEVRASSPAPWHETPTAYLETGPQEGRGGGMSPALVWHTWRRWWHLCLPIGATLAAVAVAVVWLTFEQVFEAEGWLQIGAPRILLFDTVSGSGNAAAQSDVFVRTQLAMIKSPVVLDRVVARPEVGQIAEIRTSMSPVQELKKTVSIESIDDSELYQITYSATKAADAKAVVNAVLEEYIKVYELEGETRRQTIVKQLKESKNERKAELTSLREKVRAFAQQLTGEDVTTLDAANIAMAADSPLPDLNEQLSESEFTRLVLEAKLKTLQEEAKQLDRQVPEAMIRSYIENHPDYQQHLGIAEEERHRFRENAAAWKKGGEDSFLAEFKQRVEKAEADLKAVEEELRASAVEVLTAEANREREQQKYKEMQELQDEIQAKVLAENMLKERIAAYRETHKGAGAAAVELEFARGDLARVEQVYNMLLNRINEIDTENRAPSRVEVWQAASLPAAPKELVPWRKLGVAGAAGLLAPFALAFFWEFRTQRISAGDQLASLGTLPLFGEITALPSRPRIGSAKADKGFLVQRAAFEDSVHYLCRNLVLSAGPDLRVVALTSAVSGEGKTSLSAQLAVSLAQCCQEPVILVDADVRAPDMHEIYDVPLCPGLAGVMLGENALRDAIQPTSIPNVHILPAGLAKSHPHLLLHHGRLQALLKELRKKYRYVVLDTPPVLAVGESLSVCSMADGVLICALRDVSRQQHLTMLQQRLRTAGAKALGVVLSGVSTREYAARYGDYAYHPASDSN